MARLRHTLGLTRRRLMVSSARLGWYLRSSVRPTQLPRVFGNSMAKAGSHLLAQYLRGLSRLTPLVLLDSHPIRTITEGGRRRSEQEVLHDLRRWAPGEMRWGYLPGKAAYLGEILDGNRLVYFQYRDPRDKVISHILYALEIHKRHAMHDYYLGLPDMETRIDHTIRGVPGLVGDIRSSYESYLSWLGQPGVMPVSYESLMERREETLRSMIARLEAAGVSLRIDVARALEVLGATMAPDRSPTYRAGRPGNWREHFSEANKRAFKEVAGDLLVRLGYEDGMDW